MKSSVRNQVDSIQSSLCNRPIQFCQNHYDRNATHQLIPDCQEYQEQFYCEKCSIMLASQGFNVYKLTSATLVPPTRKQINSKRKSYKKSNRKNDIEKFISKLQGQLTQLTNEEQIACDFILTSENHYGEMLESISAYFKQIQELLELQKYKAYNNLLHQRVNDQAEVRMYRQMLQNSTQQIVEMISDIQSNMDAVQNTTFDMYSAIMGGYDEKIKIIQAAVNQCPKLQQLSMNIGIPQIPKLLYSLSDKFYVKDRTTMPSSFNSHHMRPQQISINNKLIISGSDSSSFSQEESKDQKLRKNYSKSNQSEINHDINTSKDTTSLQRSFGCSLGFSFEEHPCNESRRILQNQHQFRLYKHQNHTNSHIMINSQEKYEQISKISEMLTSREVVESRQSVGAYLNFSQSRQDFVQETDTLLIA